MQLGGLQGVLSIEIYDTIILSKKPLDWKFETAIARNSAVAVTVAVTVAVVAPC